MKKTDHYHPAERRHDYHDDDRGDRRVELDYHDDRCHGDDRVLNGDVRRHGNH